jgi:hypothetical protein
MVLRQKLQAQRELAPWVRLLATNSDDLGLILGAHVVEKNQFLHDPYMCVCVCVCKINTFVFGWLVLGF